MTEAVVAVGVVSQLIVWRLVARDRLPFWPATVTTFALIGIASALAGDPTAAARPRSPRHPAWKWCRD